MTSRSPSRRCGPRGLRCTAGLICEHRVAALILDDGIHDFQAAFAGSLPPFIGLWIADGRDDVAVPVLTMLTAVSTQLRWGLRNGMWVFGAGSFADLIRKAGDYTLEGVAHQITAPTLQLFMSQRAKTHIIEIKAGHLSLISNPGAVTRVIIAAAQATS